MKHVGARRGKNLGFMDPTSRRYVTKVGLGEGQLRLFEGAFVAAGPMAARWPETTWAWR